MPSTMLLFVWFIRGSSVRKYKWLVQTGTSQRHSAFHCQHFTHLATRPGGHRPPPNAPRRTPSVGVMKRRPICGAQH